MLVSVINGRIEGFETVEEFAKRCGVKSDTVRVWEHRGLLETLHIGRDRWIKAGTPKPTTGNPGRPTGSYCNYSMSKWHKDGYLTISEYATLCGMFSQEVESAIRRKLLIVEKINGIRYIPESMPKYRLKYINGSRHRYIFIVQTNLKACK